MMEATGEKFDEVSANKEKWEWYHPYNTNYIGDLKDFITHEKLTIDEYLRVHPKSGIPLADAEIDDKYVKKFPQYLNHIANILIQKKTGNTEAVNAEYAMTLKHNNLSNYGDWRKNA